MRTKTQVFALSGHNNTVSAVLTQPTDPQVITGERQQQLTSSSWREHHLDSRLLLLLLLHGCVPPCTDRGSSG
jgi:hypothetical protein